MAALLPYLDGDESGGSGTGIQTPPVTPPANGNEPLGDAGKKALDDEREARREADRRAKAAEKELADLKADAQKRADAEAAEQGKWKELAEKREADLTVATSDRDTIASERDALAAFFDAQYAAAIKDMPDVVKAFAPPADASFAVKADWLAKAQEQVKKLGTVGSPGNRPNPKPSNGQRDVAAATARARPSYTA